MSKRKFTFFVLALAMLAATAAAQDRLTDDRELFMGVPTSSSIIRPNVMILVDVTGSMTQSIYHPYYNRKNDYRLNTSGSLLPINNLSTYFYGSGTGFMDTYLPASPLPYIAGTTKTMTREFRLCRTDETIVTTFDVRAKVGSVGNVTGQPTWRRWNLNSVTGTFVINQIINYIGVDNLPHQTRIRQVYSQTRLYIDKQYEATYVEPKINVYFYVNPHSESRTTSVALMPLGTDCGAGKTGYDIKLYAKPLQNVTGEAENDYEYNYLCWLFFNATPAQIAEVNNWSNTGEFTAGVPAGRCKISVAREAVQQIITDNYDKFNLGLATFSSSSSGASLKVKISQQNLSSSLASFQTATSAMLASGSTPLASAMADMWSYFKGTYKTNYNHNDGSQSLDADSPIYYWCQSNYVILVTDGESYSDQSLTAGRFAGSLLATNPDVSNSWGVADGHDITINSSGVVTNNWYNTTFTNYCPNWSCWNSNGSDWLDDIAFLMYHNDLFPDTIYDGVINPTSMPTKQFVETFTIGFSINNDMLFNTAEYGNTSKGAGAYRSANNYSELMDAIQNFIVNIQLRDFGFSSFTAPKKVSSAAGEGSSFVGYFKPRSGDAIWEGHLQAFKLTDKWCADSNGDGISNDNCITYYGSKLSCENANSGLTCLRSIDLASTPDWDTATLIAAGGDRLLYTHNYASGTPLALINFTDVGNIPTLRPLFGVATNANAQTIVDKIKTKQLADIFHSDIAYVGPPIPGKKYLKNLNPSECNTDDKASNANCFEKLAVDQANRQKVLYVGTNDGIIHQVNATSLEANSGKELWGFIPDEVLPTLATIAIDNEFAFTTDGRMQVDDIYYRGTTNMWKTLLAFGLRDGGDAFYALDITTAPSQPVILWKFKEPTYSGKSWGKPNFGKIKYFDGNETIDLWVVIVAGGFAFNNENPSDLRGKAIFVLDASTGLPLWTLAFHGSGQADDSGTPEIDTVLDSSNLIGLRYRTVKPEFNYCIPSALIPVDRDSDGYLDTIYYGNVAGHMFKTDISPSTPNTWKSYLLFKNTATPTISARVSSAVGTLVTLSGVSGAFAENQNVFASGATSSHAMGIVNGVNSATSLTIAYTPNSGPSFQVNDTIVVPKFDPIYLSPAIFFDPCYNLWVAFGTGDRLRSRTNPDSGKFAAFRDGTTLVSSTQTQKTDLTTSDLVSLSWTGDTLAQTDVNVTNKWGWYFTFPQSANHEKMFDPEPLVLPDMHMIPHIYFNTYQPSTIITSTDCNAPETGNMKFYDLTMNYCGDGTVEGARESGRIAGGGMFQGSDFILYEGTGNVASIPPLQDIKPIKLIYTGGLLFFKEKKR